MRYLRVGDKGEWHRRAACLCAPRRLVVKIWASVQFVRGAFVVFCVCCPVSPILQYPKKALQTKRGWSGERGGAGGDFVFLPLFLPPGLVAC